MNGAVTASPYAQPVATKILKITVRAAGLAAGQPANAPVDRLAVEDRAAGAHFDNDVTSRKLGRTRAHLEPPDSVENRVSAVRTAVGELGLQRGDGDGRALYGVVAVRIV